MAPRSTYWFRPLAPRRSSDSASALTRGGKYGAGRRECRFQWESGTLDGPYQVPDGMAPEPPGTRSHHARFRKVSLVRVAQRYRGAISRICRWRSLVRSGHVRASRLAGSDGRLPLDRSGEGLPALPGFRLEHRPHPASTAESLKAAAAFHDLPIAALFQARFCRTEGDRQAATGAAERFTTNSNGSSPCRSLKLPPAQKAESPMVDPARTSPIVSTLRVGVLEEAHVRLDQDWLAALFGGPVSSPPAVVPASSAPVVVPPSSPSSSRDAQCRDNQCQCQCQPKLCSF
jgi:hypothetical protein